MAEVVAVARSLEHDFSKQTTSSIELIAGEGVAGDCHCGVTVKHRSRVAKDPTQPNLRQVHLIHAELFEELALSGHDVGPGQLGENITTRGIDLLSLPRGTLLKIGPSAVVEVTGLRNPCQQIEDFQTGLLANVLVKTDSGALVRKTGVMGIVQRGGIVRRGDAVLVELPSGAQVPLEKV
jgi:MOSC domain-containing protein YiiM